MPVLSYPPLRGESEIPMLAGEIVSRHFPLVDINIEKLFCRGILNKLMPELQVLMMRRRPIHAHFVLEGVHRNRIGACNI